MKGLPKVVLNLAYKAGSGPINWYPGHMASANRQIRERLRVIDLVLEVRDARIPLSSGNEEFQELFCRKRRLIVLNKSDLANANLMPKWKDYFETMDQRIAFVNAHNRESVKLMLQEVRLCLKDAIEKRPTLLIMVVGIPNSGKSALINAMHIIGHSSSSQEKLKKATVGPLPGVTVDMAGFKIGHQPSIYVLDTPGVLVPNIRDLDTGLKLALTGAVKDSVVGEERLARYLLATLNGRSAPLKWKVDPESSAKAKEKAKVKLKRDEVPTPKTLLELKRLALLEKKSEKKKKREWITDHNQDHFVLAVREALASTLSEFDGCLEDEGDMECLVDKQMTELRKVLKVPMDLGDAGWTTVAKKLLNLYRVGRLGQYTLDAVPEEEEI
eukprot:c19641_g1_i1 orf=379-1533(-)